MQNENDPEKVAFTAVLQVNDGKEEPENVTRIGWLYQLNPASKVALVKQQQCFNESCEGHIG